MSDMRNSLFEQLRLNFGAETFLKIISINTLFHNNLSKMQTHRM